MAPQARVRQLGDTNGFGSFYNSLPIVSRVLLTTYLCTGLFALFETRPLLYIYHSWEFIFRELPQVWRLVLNFGFLGKPSMNFLLNLVWLIQYGVAYEKSTFRGNAADSIAMAGWGMVCILLIDLLIPFCRAPFHGQALIFMMLYLWSKNTSTTEVSFFGVVEFKALYLPFALLLVDIFEGTNPFIGLTGIAAGHMYRFGTEVFPQLYGRKIMGTPQWLELLILRHQAQYAPRVGRKRTFGGGKGSSSMARGVPSRKEGGSSPLQQYIHKLSVLHQTMLDKSSPQTLYRWLAWTGCLLLYLLRVFYFVEGFYIVTYAMAIFNLNLLLGFLTPLELPMSDDGGLPSKANDEFRPFVRRLPEFKFWYASLRSILMGTSATFFPIFDVPVFWQFLVVFWLILFFVTMKRQIKHMIKYKYVPFSFGKRTYGGGKSSSAPRDDDGFVDVPHPQQRMSHAMQNGQRKKSFLGAIFSNSTTKNVKELHSNTLLCCTRIEQITHPKIKNECIQYQQRIQMYMLKHEYRSAKPMADNLLSSMSKEQWYRLLHTYLIRVRQHIERFMANPADIPNVAHQAICSVIFSVRLASQEVKELKDVGKMLVKLYGKVIDARVNDEGYTRRLLQGKAETYHLVDADIVSLYPSGNWQTSPAERHDLVANMCRVRNIAILDMGEFRKVMLGTSSRTVSIDTIHRDGSSSKQQIDTPVSSYSASQDDGFVDVPPTQMSGQRKKSVASWWGVFDRNKKHVDCPPALPSIVTTYHGWHPSMTDDDSPRSTGDDPLPDVFSVPGWSPPKPKLDDTNSFGRKLDNLGGYMKNRITSEFD